VGQIVMEIIVMCAKLDIAILQASFGHQRRKHLTVVTRNVGKGIIPKQSSSNHQAIIKQSIDGF